MKKHLEISENLLQKMEKHNPAIHEEMEALTKDIEMDEVIMKRRSVPGAADFKISPDESQTVVGMSSTRFVDRDREIVVPKGVDLSQFRKAPVKLWNHDWQGLPVGKNVAIRAVKDGLIAKTWVGGTDFAMDIFKAIQAELITTSSIGFIPTKVFSNGGPGFSDEVGRLKKLWPDLTSKIIDGVSSIISKSILLEDSYVNVASNIDSGVMAVSSKSFDITKKHLEKMGYIVEEVEEGEALEGLEAWYKSLPIVGKTPPKEVEKEEKSVKNVETPPESVNTKGEDEKCTIRLVRRAKDIDPALVKLRSMNPEDRLFWEMRKRCGAIR